MRIRLRNKRRHRPSRTLAVIVCVIGCVPICAAQRAANGTILQQEPLRLSLSYEDWLTRAYDPAYADPLDPKTDMQRIRAYYTAERYSALDSSADVEVSRLVYSSDGLTIRGFKVEPKVRASRLPVIVWCRGGIGDTGMIVAGDLMVMSNWARQGFLVLATQYRGSRGSEGKDEDGGDDVHDVMALIAAAHAMPEADAANVFLYGYSRGGMMAYQALRGGAPVRAAAINSGVSEFVAYRLRPDAQAMEALIRAAVPNFDKEKRSGFKSRSALQWASQIKQPVLLLHGTSDWRVPVSTALHMAAALQQAGRPYELHIYEGGSHVVLSGDQQQIDREVLAFFQRNLPPTVSPQR